MSYGAGMDDCVLILHMDRKDHILMNYAQQIDRLPIFEQEAVALFVSKGSFFIHNYYEFKKNHTVYYANTGCGVFKRGVQNWKDFFPKNQHTQRKSLNFENWINGGLRSFQKLEF